MPAPALDASVERCISWGIVITARATYLKPWYEGFADAQPTPWQTLLVCPADAPHHHPAELTTPVHPNLTVREVDVKKRTLSTGGGRDGTHYGARHTWLPGGGVAEALRRGNTRGVIVHEFSPFTLMGLFYARRHRLPVISFTDVGRDNSRRYSLKTRLWHAFWNLGVDGMMAGCPASRVPVSGRRLPFVESYHAVDSSVFKPLARKMSGGPVVFVYSGQFIQRKGIDLWFAAAKRLLEQGHTNFRLRLLGGGDEAWLRGCAARLGLLNHIEWCGYLHGESMVEALGSADVFVLPSRWDSYAAVVHEAACLGLPLLVSRHAGAAEALVKDGITGWQVDPDDAETFAARMVTLLDSATRSRFGTAARQRGEELCARKRGRAVWEWLTQTFELPDS